MNEADNETIEVVQAPLSHLKHSRQKTALLRLPDWRNATVSIIVLAVAAAAVFWQPEDLPPTDIRPDVIPSAQPGAENQSAPRVEGQLAPFAQVQRQRVREQAQAALAEFVERQIVLEENMQVAAWGSEELTAAMALAKDGDSAFLQDKFADSLQAYLLAVNRINAVIEQGNRLFEHHLEEAEKHIQGMNPEAATQALEHALTIKPEEAGALALQQRADRLPRIIGKLRTARNHELGGRYAQALALYDEIQQIDPQTTGLAELRNTALNARRKDDLADHISRGFAALEERRFDLARQAFNLALKVDPDNGIAKGGLQQVAEQNDLNLIQRKRHQAEQAMAEERWREAADAYQSVLVLDSNIQFAVNGKSSAQAHLRAKQLLEKISTEPGRLSSQKLYLDAVAILAEAKALEQAGPNLAALITRVDKLLMTYREPVEVVLLSDNATRITMSNVGELGFFESKTLSVRPGRYTIRGSQHGCRDIYISVEVLPGIAPLDLRCAERIGSLD